MEEGRGAGLLWWRACVKGVLVAPVLLGGHNEREVARWEGDPASLSSTRPAASPSRHWSPGFSLRSFAAVRDTHKTHDSTLAAPRRLQRNGFGQQHAHGSPRSANGTCSSSTGAE